MIPILLEILAVHIVLTFDFLSPGNFCFSVQLEAVVFVARFFVLHVFHQMCVLLICRFS